MVKPYVNPNAETTGSRRLQPPSPHPVGLTPTASPLYLLRLSMASTISPEKEEEDGVCINTVRKAVRALLKWRKLHPRAAQKPASQLLDEQHEFLDEENDDGNEDFIYLLLTLKKIPPKDLSKTPHKIPLPNPLHTHHLPHLNLCLIIDDRPVKSPSRVTAEVALKKIKSQDIPITKVLKLSKLKSDCKSFEGRRNLYNSFDRFFADKRLVPLLPSVLGKQFYKKKKVPVPLDLRGSVGWKEQIERACNSALLCLGSGTCSVMRVGENGMESDEIVENFVAAIKGIAEVVPKKWGGIRALHVKLSDSLALPIYDALAEVRANVEDGFDLESRKNGVLKDEKTMMGWKNSKLAM